MSEKVRVAAVRDTAGGNAMALLASGVRRPNSFHRTSIPEVTRLNAEYPTRQPSSQAVGPTSQLPAALTAPTRMRTRSHLGTRDLDCAATAHPQGDTRDMAHRCSAP